MKTISIRPVTGNDLDVCTHIEATCFAPSEAATRERIQARIEQFPQGFHIAECDGQAAGMVNACATHSDDITRDDLKKMIGHQDSGANMVIFSLAVLPQFQGQGVARRLMRHFIERSRNMGKARILLLCKDYHIDFYRKLGYRHGGLSRSQHGGFAWHEMIYNIQT